jgi:two-component system NtrC family response regulator
LPPDADGTSEGFKLPEKSSSMRPTPSSVTGNNDREHATARWPGAMIFCCRSTPMLELIVNRAYKLYQLEGKPPPGIKQMESLAGVITGSDAMQVYAGRWRSVARRMPRCWCWASRVPARNCWRDPHGLSSRLHKRFVAINCAAIPENRSSSCSATKGAFTGAAARPRQDQTAAGAPLLDEVGDMPCRCSPLPVSCRSASSGGRAQGDSGRCARDLRHHKDLHELIHPAASGMTFITDQ